MVYLLKMVIFYSYVKLPEGKTMPSAPPPPGKSPFLEWWYKLTIPTLNWMAFLWSFENMVNQSHSTASFSILSWDDAHNMFLAKLLASVPSPHPWESSNFHAHIPSHSTGRPSLVMHYVVFWPGIHIHCFIGEIHHFSDGFTMVYLRISWCKNVRKFMALGPGTCRRTMVSQRSAWTSGSRWSPSVWRSP